MAEKRGLFEKIFGKPDTNNIQYQQYKLLNSWQSTFVPFSGTAWNENTVRAAVDGFARRAAVICPRHVRETGGKTLDVPSSINQILQVSPNPYSTAYKFYYRIATQYKIYNNAFIYPVWSELGGLSALYLINANTIELLEYNNELYCRFNFVNGNQKTVPYVDMIHVGTHFNGNDIFGDGNTPINGVLATANTLNQSMSKFAELIAQIRGILEVQGGAKSEDLTARRDAFIRDNLDIDADGAGIVVTDSKYKYTPINDKSEPIPEGQLKYVRDEIYNYFGTNEKIIQNKESNEESNAYYESEIKPFYSQLSQAFTSSLFRGKEIGFGNRIICESNRLQYEDVPNKIAAISLLNSMGAITLDQALTIFGLPTIGGEEGARRVQSLNMVSAANADEYQLNKKKEEQEGKDDDKAE